MGPCVPAECPPKTSTTPARTAAVVCLAPASVRLDNLFQSSPFFWLGVNAFSSWGKETFAVCSSAQARLRALKLAVVPHNCNVMFDATLLTFDCLFWPEAASVSHVRLRSPTSYPMNDSVTLVMLHSTLPLSESVKSHFKLIQSERGR